MGLKMLFVAAVAGAALALPGASAAQAPVGQDSVTFTGGPATAGVFLIRSINATSGPSGENPTGRVEAQALGAFEIFGPVTCLAVSGNTATINFQDESGVFGITTVQVTDSQPDTFDLAPLGRPPTECAPLPPTGMGGTVSGGDIAVVDAPPLPTTKDQCKNGGWRQYGFRNQGECNAFVREGV